MTTTRPITFGKLPSATHEEVLILFDNRLIGRKSASVVADSTVPEGNMIAQNLLTEDRHDFWRSDSVATRSQAPTPEIIVDYALGLAKDIDLVYMGWTNSLLPWWCDLYIGDPAASGVLQGSTGRMNPLVKADPGEFYYLDGPFDAEITIERALELQQQAKLLVFEQLERVFYGITHVRFRFDVADGANGTLDYIQGALLGAGRAFAPHFNMKLGVKLKPVDRSSKRRSAGGRATGVSRPTDSELTFSLEHLTDEEGLTRIFTDWVRREGSLARVLVVKEPEKRHLFYDGGSFLGTLETFDAVAIDQKEGAMGNIIAAKSITGVTIQETE